MLPITILAGGLATRLRPVTEKIPKSMVLINDQPFVFHQLQLLKEKRIEKVHFCLGYLGEMVEEYVRLHFKDAFELSFSYDGNPLLGTGGAVVNAFRFLPETFFITYGDSYLDVDYLAINNVYLAENQDDYGLMTVYNNAGKWDSSNVIFKNNILEYYSKKNKIESMNYIDFGIGILAKQHFKNRMLGENFDLSEIYEKLSLEQKLIGFEVFNRFYEVGSFSGIEDLSNYLKIKQ